MIFALSSNIHLGCYKSHLPQQYSFSSYLPQPEHATFLVVHTKELPLRLTQIKKLIINNNRIVLQAKADKLTPERPKKSFESKVLIQNVTSLLNIMNLNNKIKK